MIGRLFAAILLGLVAFAPVANAQTSTRAQVVVELYTSQGCSQCPRANRLLGMFSREAGVLALTFPVGLWDYLGWQDTLARPEFGDRQRAYSTSLHVRGRFTPQLVLNGANQISASYWDEARAALTQAQAAPLTAGPSVAITRLRSNRARVTIGSGARRQEADVWMMAYDPGPVSVFIGRGINQNRRIYHYNLVGWLDRVGAWNGGPIYYERAHCTPECAVIVQEANGGRILAAAFTSRDR